MPRSPDPTKVALLLCDHVLKEAGTNKHSLLGVFDTVQARSLPHIHPRCAFYVRIGNAEGDYAVEIQFVDLEDDEMKIVGSISGNASFKSRHQTSDFFLFVNGLTFRHAGRYMFRLVMNDHLVGEVTLTVNEPAGKGESNA